MPEPVIVDDLKICTFVATRVVYMRFRAAWFSSITEMWHRFGNWRAAKELMLPSRRMFGIAQENPNITPPDQTRYDVCLEIDGNLSPPVKSVCKRFPAAASPVCAIPRYGGRTPRGLVEASRKDSASCRVRPRSRVSDRAVRAGRRRRSGDNRIQVHALHAHREESGP
jgi:hypothetical protein